MPAGRPHSLISHNHSQLLALRATLPSSYMMDLRACASDDDHIVTPFRVGKYWGCLSVSNHASLRFRNPVYRTLRELVMTYFDDVSLRPERVFFPP